MGRVARGHHDDISVVENVLLVGETCHWECIFHLGRYNLIQRFKIMIYLF